MLGMHLTQRALQFWLWQESNFDLGIPTPVVRLNLPMRLALLKAFNKFRLRNSGSHDIELSQRLDDGV